MKKLICLTLLSISLCYQATSAMEHATFGELQAAVYIGNCDFLLQHATDIYQVDRVFGNCLLHPVHFSLRDRRSVWDEYHRRCMRLLIGRGININHRNNNSWTPLFEAAIYGRLELARELLCYPHVQVNVADRDGMTPLQLTSVPAIAQLLIDHGGAAMVNHRDRLGNTPLHIAARTNNVLMCQFLLAHGADASLQDRKGNTPLQDAINRKNAETARLLVRHDLQKTLWLAMLPRPCAQSPLRHLETNALSLIVELVVHPRNFVAPHRSITKPTNWCRVSLTVSAIAAPLIAGITYYLSH